MAIGYGGHVFIRNQSNPKSKGRRNNPAAIVGAETVKKERKATEAPIVLPVQNITITSNNQSGDITAQTVNLGEKGRTVTQTQSETIVGMLRPEKGSRVGLFAMMSNPESYTCATRLKDAFALAGLEVAGIGEIMLGTHPIGIKILVKTNEPPSTALSLSNAFKASGIEHSVQLLPPMKNSPYKETVTVFVGNKE